MKSYTSYVKIESKVHKKQNRLTILCIAVAVFLITGIFSMVEIMVREETKKLVGKHGLSEVKAFFESEALKSLYPIAFVLLLFVVLAGSLMITSSLSSQVAQKTKLYGMMRCLGMSKKQVKRIVFLEALNWCKIGIPAGVIAGTVAEWILCLLLRYAVGGEFAGVALWQISISGILFGVIVGIITVLLAARRPARTASKVSPITAVSGMAEDCSFSTMNVNGGIGTIETKLGISQAIHGKKKLFSLTASFALSIVLFLCFSVIIELVNCLLPQYESDGDFEILSKVSNEENNLSNTLSKDYIDQFLSIDGVEMAYGRRSIFDQPVSTKKAFQVSNVDVISFSEYDLCCLSKDNVLNQKANYKKVAGDQPGAFVISDSSFEVGDEIMISPVMDDFSSNGLADAYSFMNMEKENESYALTVAGTLSVNIFEDDGLCHGKTTLIVSDETFERVFGISAYGMIRLKIDGKNQEEIYQKVVSLLGEDGEIINNLTNNQHGTYLAFISCVYIFLGIVAFVSIINIMNGISMSVSSKMKQFGMMKAIGMDHTQLTKMVISESLVYSLLGLFSGLLLGLFSSKWLYGFLVTSHFPYAHWQMPWMQIVVIMFYMLFASLLGVLLPIRSLKQMTVTELIHES